MRLEEVESPRPGSGEVLIEVRAAGVNPVDAYILTGTHSVRPSLPYTPGHDGAGVVIAAAPGVGFSQGDRVYLAGSVTGSYAERAVARAEQVHRLPATTSFAEGAALGIPYATAYRALFQVARALPGESVLVHGASGGVGIAAVQLARAAGLTVIGTAGSERRRTLVLEQGAHHALDHDAPDLAAQVKALSSGRGVDILLEMQAHRNLALDLELVADRGRIVVIGSRGRIEIDPRQAMIRDATVRGMLLFNATAAELASAHAAVGAALESGGARPVIGLELPLAEAGDAHRALDRGAGGKIVLVP
jgi:NADPH2:quinone reductase